jgi:antitoxin PrlF
MIHSRVTSKAQTTVPAAVRRALGIEPGDEIGWELEGDRVVLRRVEPDTDPFDSPFALFTEWADELDSEAFDKL